MLTPTPRVIVQPVLEPLSLDEALAHCRISDASEMLPGSFLTTGDFVERLIKAVRQHLERRTGWAFLEQTLEIALDYWPGYEYGEGNGVIELPRATPLLSVESIKYTDCAGLETTIDTADYVLDTSSIPGRIAPAYNVFWPSFIPRPLLPIRIRYVAGWPTSASPAVPYQDEDVKTAMLFLLGHFYNNREAVVIGENVTIESKRMEYAIDSLLFPLEVQAF